MERLLIGALAVVSTLAAGLAAAPEGGAAVARRTMVLAVVLNVAALPLAVWAAVRLAGLDAAGGLVLAAAAPGGSTGPLLAVLGGGEAALAARAFVVLTVAGTGSALAVTAALDAGSGGAVAVAALVGAATALAPLVAGLAVRARAPAWARHWQPWLARLALALLVATVAVLAARHGAAARLADVVVGAGATVAALAIGRVAGGPAARCALAQVSAVRNLTLALVVLAAIGAPPARSVSVLGYGLAMYVVALAAAVGGRSAMKAP